MTLLEKIKSWFGGKFNKPVYCWYSNRLRKYKVCQIIKHKKIDNTLLNGVVIFDWQGDAPITIDEFKHINSQGDFSYCFSPIPRIFMYQFDFPACRHYTQNKQKMWPWFFLLHSIEKKDADFRSNNPTDAEQTDLFIQDMPCVDLQGIAARYPNLSWLNIEAINIECGMIRNISALKKLKNLEYFHCLDMFGFDGSEIPGPEDLPRLYYIDFESYPLAAKTVINQRWGHVDGVTCRLNKGRTQAWLERNHDNPFRKWEYERDYVSTACIRTANAIYKKAKSKVMVLENSIPQQRPTAFLELVRELLAGLNQLNERNAGFLDEDDRDDVFSMICGLLGLGKDRCCLELDESAVKQIYDAERKW